jgi:aminocarboxymuconate-semialdehyde decarboxylase
MKTIDCDTHYWPIPFLDHVNHEAKGQIETVDDDTVAFYRNGELIHRFKTTRWDLDLRKAEMDEEGFDVQVLIPDNRPFLYELDDDLGNAMAQAFNDFAAVAVKDEDRFIPVSWLYLPDMKGAVAEFIRSVEALGIRAVKVTGGYGDCDLDDPAMWPLYEVAEQHDVPILVHPAARAFESQTAHPWLIGADRFEPMRFLSSCTGFPMTYMHTITRLVFSGVMDRFPKLKFAFFEGGCGWVPFLRTQLDMETKHRSFASYQKESGITLQRKPSEYFDRFYISAISYEPYLADTARQWGADHRIIIGSDFDHGDPIATWPHTVTDLATMKGLSEADRARILGGNAADLFGLVPAA